MKKAFSMMLALIMIFATVIATLGTVSATGGYGESHPVSVGEISWIGNEPKPYLYAYYSDKVVLDGDANQDGADGKPGDMGTVNYPIEYDGDVGSGEDHYIEYVFDTVDGVKVAATWNDTTDVLYLAVPATVTELAIEIGGKTLAIDRVNLTVTGIDGAKIKKGDIYEIAIPMNKTLELDYDGMYVVTDIKVTTDAGTFDGKLAFTSMVPVIIAAGDDSYLAKNIKTPDDIKITTISEAGRNYRHWMLATDEVEDGYKLRATYTDEELAAKNGSDPRAGLLIYSFDPMYGDVLDAETYVLKADVKIEGLPKVPESAIASSRDIGLSGLKYDTTMPHVTFYLSNNTNAMGAVMNCGAIFNTEKGLKMVVSTFVGNGTVIDLGKNVGDEFELKIINNVVKYDSDTKMIDKSENYVFEVYVDDVKVGEAVGKQVRGSKICEYGFGFNVISNMQGAAKVEGAETGITVDYYQWREGGLTISNFVSSYEKTYDIEALAALSANELKVKATNRFLKQDVVNPPVVTPPVVTPPVVTPPVVTPSDDVMIATLNDITFDGDLTITKGMNHVYTSDYEIKTLGTPHLAEYCIDVTLENGALGAAYSLEKKELYIGIYALEEVCTVDITVGGTDYTVDVACGYVDGGEGYGQVVASNSDYTYEIILPLDEIAIKKVARGVGADISITVESSMEDTFEGQLLFSKYAAGFTYNSLNKAASMLLHEQATDNGDGTVTLVNDGTNARVYSIPMVPNVTKDLVLKFDLTVDSMPYSTIEDVANDSPGKWGTVATPRLWIALIYRFKEMIYMNIQNTADDGLVLNVYENCNDGLDTVKKQHSIVLGKETGEKMVLELEWSEADADGKYPLSVYVDGALVGSVENAMNIEALGKVSVVLQFNAQWTKTDMSNDTIDVTWGNISVNEISDLYDEDAYNAMCNNLVNKPTIPDNDFDDITPPDISIKDEYIDGNNKPGIGGIIGDMIGGLDKEDGDKNNNNSNSNNNDKNKNDVINEEVMVLPMGGCFSSISGVSALAVISSALIATVLGKKKREE